MGYTTSTVHGIEVPDSAEANNVPEDIGKVVTALEAGSIVKRLTGAQIAALTSPQKPAGLLVYNTTTSTMQVSDGTNFADVPGLPNAGAWTTYTPSVSGWTLGNGSVTGKYQKHGKRVDGWAKLTLGTTTTWTGSSALLLGLPVSLAASAVNTGVACQFYCATAYSVGAAFMSASGIYVYRYDYVTDQRALITTSLPRTWTSGNFVEVSFTYEAA